MSTENIHDTIHARIDDFIATFSKGDTTEIADFYTDSAMLLPTGFDIVEGKPSIAAFWQDAIAFGIRNVKLDVIEMEHKDDTVIEVSNYALSDADHTVLESGKGIMIWKHQDGVWKMHRDIWNTNAA